MAINSINGSAGNPMRATGQSQKTGAATGVASRDSDAGKTDGAAEIKLSQESLRLRKLEASFAKDAPVDMPRVEALRKAIASGEYQVDAQRLAGHLLDAEAE
ncbi:MAG: flagellar biosynthesis anti-sigma factor FlgM [Gammaproteobacteria bacterium]